MGFQPLSDLFKGERPAWQEQDVAHFIQDYLRRSVRSEAVYCQRFRNGRAIIRVDKPTLEQAVRLLEYDLRQELQKQADVTLNNIKIVH